MPVRQAVDSGFAVQPLIPTDKPAPSFLNDTVPAAFGLENDVVNAYQAMTAPDFPRNPDYPITQKLKDSGLWDDYRDNFLHVQSDEEFNYVASKITEEQQQRDVLLRSGWAGTIAAIGAGVLSPTMALPFMGEERGLAAVGRGLFMGAVAGAAQEIPLQANQETRTAGDSLFSIAAATVLGGFLGGAHVALLPGEEQSIVDSMANVRRTTPVPTPAGASVSAAEDAGVLAGGSVIKKATDILDSNPVTRSPVTDAIMSDYDTSRWTMSQLSDAGMSMEKNAAMVPTTPGGTVENRVESWYGNNVKGIEALDKEYADYVFGGNAPRFAPSVRATITGALDKTKLSKGEFLSEITKAGWNNDEHEIPAVANAAKAIRAAVYDPILKEMQAVGLLSDKIDLVADPSYINRMFDHDAIKADPVSFVDFLSSKFNTKLQEDFATKLEGFTQRQGKTDQLLEDVSKPQDQIDALREEFKSKLEALDAKAEPEQFSALEDTMSALRGAARKITGDDLASRTQRQQMLSSARDMEKAAGEPYKVFKGARSDLQRRLSNFNKSRVVLAEKLSKKVEKAERADELSMNTLNRAAKAGYKFLSEMDKWSDKVLDEKLGQLRTQFGRAGEIFDKGEERLAQLANGEQGKDSEFIAPGEITSVSPELPAGVSLYADQSGNSKLTLDNVKDNVGPDPKDQSLGKQGINFKEENGEIHIQGSYLPSEFRGQGNGFKLYKTLADYAAQKGLPIISDFDLSEAAVRVYDKLKKAGYDVIKSKDFREGSDAGYKGKFIGGIDKTGETTDGFTIRIEPKADAKQRLVAVQNKRAGVLSELSERIADAEDLGRPAVRSLINDMLQESLARIKSINDRRAIRTAKLRKAAEELKPELVDERINAIRESKASRERDFNERIRVMGGEGIDLNAGKADFSDFARKAATEVKDKIQGTYLRLPTVDIMQGQRGATLARVLDIPSQELAPWLETNIEKLMRAHVRTMAPDIEITRKLGSVNGEEQFVKLAEEMNAKLDAAKAAVDKKGQPLSDKAKQKEMVRIQDEYARQKQNLETVIGRLRHNWGLPSDPDGMAYRMAKVVMNLNVLRFMGGVTIASIPDVARPIMRYGLTRTFRDGWIPLVSNFKKVQMSAREARLAGVGIDAYTSSRAYSMLDVTQDLGRGSKFERGVEYATGKQGLIAAFSYWTDAMKGITSAIAIPKITDSIAEVATKEKPSREAMNFLAQNGIGYPEVEMIWKELSNGEGGLNVNGVWLPNTEGWKNPEAVRTFRAALAREVNNTITTPGVERPAWTNATTAGKLVSQFKSFSFSSTYKTSLAGLQQRDMAFVNGTLVSLALGALSYYLYGVSRGGDAYDRMVKAGPGAWADQATQRSGIMSVLGLGQDLLSRIPMTAPYTTFSGGRTVRRGGDDLVSALLGPSFDFAKTSADVFSQLDDPTKSTLHKGLGLAPWRNLTGFSRVYDAIENAAPLKEKR